MICVSVRITGAGRHKRQGTGEEVHENKEQRGDVMLVFRRRLATESDEWQVQLDV